MRLHEIVVSWPKVDGKSPRLLARFAFAEGLDQVLVTYGQGPSCQRWSRARAEHVLELMRQNGYQVAEVTDAGPLVPSLSDAEAAAAEPVPTPSVPDEPATALSPH